VRSTTVAEETVNGGTNLNGTKERPKSSTGTNSCRLRPTRS